MEILFISHKFPPATGGMEKQSFELITGMEKYGRVHRIVYNGRGNLLLFFLTLQKRIVRICRENPGIRVIHYNDGLLAAFCLWHKRYTHLKRTATLHGLDVVFPSRIYHRYILPRFNQYSQLIAVSTATAEKAMALGIRKDKLITIRNGVDIQAMPRPQTTDNHLQWLADKGIHLQHKHLLVMMGRPVIRKGFSWFISQVMPHLKEHFILLIIGPFQPAPTITERCLALLPPGFRTKIMLFLGYPSDQAAIRKLLKAPQSRTSVKHLGRLPLEQVQEVLTASRAFLMPNIAVAGDMEGFGLVCLEASMMGTIVFASAIDGIPDAIQHQKNGFLLPSNQPEAWVAQLNELVKTPNAYSDLSEKFRHFTISHYSWDDMVKAYYQLFSIL